MTGLLLTLSLLSLGVAVLEHREAKSQREEAARLHKACCDMCIESRRKRR